MNNHVYKLLGLTGLSSTSIEDAVTSAIANTHGTICNTQ